MGGCSVAKDYRQIEWDDMLADDCRQLLRLAIREDLDRGQDWTSVSLIDGRSEGAAIIVARGAGTAAGLAAARLLLDEYDRRLEWTAWANDGQAIEAGQRLARVSGPARSLLTAERPLLNLIGHLSGIATLTARYVAGVVGTRAKIYDTRKTMPGWRRLEKYAVRCGGGFNHRLGLYDGILIKDNHLAFGATNAEGEQFSPAIAVQRARKFLSTRSTEPSSDELLIEIEVESLEQLGEVLPESPDIVLLDNMTPERLAAAVALRDQLNPAVELEASGGINLVTVGAVAKSGVERISVGALTHSADWFDVGLDWEFAPIARPQDTSHLVPRPSELDDSK